MSAKKKKKIRMWNSSNGCSEESGPILAKRAAFRGRVTDKILGTALPKREKQERGRMEVANRFRSRGRRNDQGTFH